MEKKYVVIVAGGSGSRMSAQLPKQFLTLAGLPILMHTIKAFYKYSAEVEIVLVLPNDHRQTWSDLKKEYDFTIPHAVVSGGKSRSESVQNGLESIEGKGWVAIHDGARPFVSQEIIERTFTAAMKFGNGVAAVPLKDSIRKLTQSGLSKSVPREDYQLVQTPQTFDLELIKDAFDKISPDENFTDEASLIEKAGIGVRLVGGSYDNIKITTPEDMLVAEMLLEKGE